DKDAAVAAINYVETKVRPIYFEEEVQAEIKKPFSTSLKSFNFTKELRSLVRAQYVEAQNNYEVSEEEYQASLSLKTPYDEIIAGYLEDQQKEYQNFEYYQNFVNSYEHQNSYPYDQVNCDSV